MILRTIIIIRSVVEMLINKLDLECLICEFLLAFRDDEV